jgi:hypothetical protein
MALSASLTAWSAEVYRSVDADGTVSYSDRPVGENAETFFIDTRTPTAPPPVTPPAAGAPETPAEEASDSAALEPREPTPEERAEERERNCGIARERLDRYLTSRRLYRSTPDGERAYLSDAEIDEARARAAADVEEWCD